ncbi:MAG: class I SAM-dependent methyltransferase [Lachnospiraceae bacterium]|nr:class I SAM-dependent methyltransferase [Lachnospiraceae bacterium]
MIIQNIDKGRAFDWGKTSEDYAKYRDIYPQEFYDYILQLGLCKDGQSVLDIGTGTGVLPRNMYKYGAKWTGTDIAENQILQAKELSKEAGMEIDFFTSKAEEVSFPDNTFDVITACQCIWYFDHDVTSLSFAGMLKPGGKFLILYMGWLPYEDHIAGKSEEIILKHNPNWTAHGDTVHPVLVPEQYLRYFELLSQEQFRVDIPFTREGWHGRMRACRGVGASMAPEQLAAWNKEHMEMLEKEASERFMVKHYISIAELQVKKG